MAEETKKFFLRVPIDIHTLLVAEAKEERLTLHTFIIRLLDQHTKARKKRRGTKA